jgi:hypothetical protein
VFDFVPWLVFPAVLVAAPWHLRARSLVDLREVCRPGAWQAGEREFDLDAQGADLFEDHVAAHAGVADGPKRSTGELLADRSPPW